MMMKSVKITSNGIIVQPYFLGKDLHFVSLVDTNTGYNTNIPKADLKGVVEELSLYCSSQAIYNSTEPTDEDDDTITTTDLVTSGTIVIKGDDTIKDYHVRNVKASNGLSKLSRGKFKHRESEK